MNFFFSSRRRHTFFFQAEDGIRDRSPSRGLGDVYKRQDFNDNTSGESDSYKDKSGFRKLFSTKNANYGGVAGLSLIHI